MSTVTIQIDTSQLSYPEFLIPGVTPAFLNGATTPSITLAPGTYSFQQASGYFADFTFTVDAAGHVGFDPRFNGFLQGAGTSRLVIVGFPIHLVATALDHDLLPMVAGAGVLSHTSAHDLRLVPASHYGFQPGSGIVAAFEFGLDLSGHVVVNAAYSSFASASGSTLTITGHRIQVDARALSHDLLPISLLGYTGGSLPRASVNQLTLIPASGYDFQPGSGIVASFLYAINAAGSVVVDPAYASFASAAGSTLTIRGHTIHIDGRGLSHDLLPISLIGYTGGFLPRASINQLTLIPAVGYTFQPGSGIVADMNYTVGVDGNVSFPVSCNGFLAGSGTDTLIVGGYPVLVDATLADSNLLSIINAVGVVAEARRYLFAVLIPAEGYAPQTAHGVLSHGFGIQRDGSVIFDPGVAGHYVLTTIPRLEIHGATPF
jgi:hypothetical protein